MRTTRMVAVAISLSVMAEPARAAAPMHDLSQEKVLYCVGYAHLDTQWRWDFCTTIDQYIRDTLVDNFDRFEKFPEYVFNFTGSVRYEMMKEYYPEHYERLKKYIADGRWFVSGSSVDEGDVNVPSAEAIIRQVLYGNQFFRREFGRESRDFMLPDCFGFPASMPSIWAHCGLLGFSTQKLTWGSAVGIPFKIGVWEGPDGNSIIAALDPGSYASALEGRVDLNEEWADRITQNGERYGVFADYHYYGVGDQGGAPREDDVRNYVASIDNEDSLFNVALVSSDQLYKDITPEQRARLPRHRGDMLLTEHSAGTLTSQSYMKRWNRKNEILADAAERAAVVADWLGGAVYPREKLYKSWVRLLANQMHDILPGTSIPRAYTYSWNDEIVASNGFAAVLTDSVGAIARALDTNVEGTPIIVYNPLAIEREDIVEAEVFLRDADAGFRVFDGEGSEVPSAQLAVAPFCPGFDSQGRARIAFLAKVPPISWSVYEVRPAAEPPPNESGPRATEHQIENHCYRVTIDDNGDVSSIIDKRHGDRELLRAPTGLVFTYERPAQWPAWNMDWADRKEPPIDRVGGPAKIRVVENGPVRATVEITREARNSIFTQRISLAAGSAGERIEFHTEVDWQSTECALKASFPLKDGNPKATYNWGLGTIERGNNEPKRYEVPSHEWFDVTDPFGQYGVSVLEDCKFGSDKPSDHEVRLTLLYTPGVRDGYLDQHSQDWGRHEFVYALYPHAGDWRDGNSEWHGRRLNQPLRAFTTATHDGALGKSFSLLKVSTPQVDVRAVKLAEESGDEVIIRLQELWGRRANDVTVTLAAPITSAHEMDGQERRIGDATVRDGKLTLAMTPFQPRSFAVKLTAPPTKLTPPKCTPIKLPFNADVVSYDSNRTDGQFDDAGRTIPAEELPERIVSEGIVFELGPKEDGALNAVACEGQTIKLPGGDFDRVYVLAAATADTAPMQHFPSAQSWTGFVGQWDDRVWDREFDEVDYRCEGNVVGIKTGYVKRDPIAWFCTHRHHPEKGNEAYRFSYLFKYAVDVGNRESQIKLPNHPRTKVLAMTAARNENDDTHAAAALYDDFTDRKPIEFRHEYPPPPVPVFEGSEPTATVQIDRKDSFEDLSIGPPLKDDIIDRSRDSGREFRYLSGEYRPHPGSGAEDGVLTRLNDGEVAQNNDDTDRCVWYDNEGRFFIDLKRPRKIEQIRTYSWHRDTRAPQFFSLWASNAEEMPPADFKHGEHNGWTLLAVVNSTDLGKGGVHGSAVTPREGETALGPYRHLLWIAEDVGQGTFFTEIDIHAAK